MSVDNLFASGGLKVKIMLSHRLSRHARLALVLTLMTGCALLSGAVQAAPPLRIGEIKIAAHPALDADQRGFAAGLASAGFKEGEQVVFDRHNAEGDPVRAEAIARKFQQDKVVLIHSIATQASQAVVKSGSRIPVVFSSVTDPVFAGIVGDKSGIGTRTHTYVTGVSDRWPVDLQLQTYARLLPGARDWGTIYNPAEANSVRHIEAMREAARKLGLTLHEVTVSRGSEVSVAAERLAQKVRAIVVTSDNTTVANLDALVRVCETHKVPLFAGDIDSVERGAVAAYGMDYFLVGYAAGKKAALILKGVKPGDIPWGPMEKFSLVINQRAAAAQGIEIPKDILSRADRVIR